MQSEASRGAPVPALWGCRGWRQGECILSLLPEARSEFTKSTAASAPPGQFPRLERSPRKLLRWPEIEISSTLRARGASGVPPFSGPRSPRTGGRGARGEFRCQARSCTAAKLFLCQDLSAARAGPSRAGLRGGAGRDTTGSRALRAGGGRGRAWSGDGAMEMAWDYAGALFRRVPFPRPPQAPLRPAREPLR